MFLAWQNAQTITIGSTFMKVKKGSLYLKACLEKFDIDSSHTNDYDLLTQVWNDNLNDVHALSNFACFLHTLEHR